MGSEEDSGKKQCPSPKSLVQSSEHTARSSCHIPASHWPCLCPACPALPTALPTQEVISCCLAHQVAPAHAPALRQRASAREALQDPHLCLCVCGWGYLVAGRLPLQTAVFLRAEHRPAWLLSASPPRLSLATCRGCGPGSTKEPPQTGGCVLVQRAWLFSCCPTSLVGG